MATIYIISGEGERGTRETYSGKRTARALSARLTRERCGGDRWAHAEVETAQRYPEPGLSVAEVIAAAAADEPARA